MFSAMLIALFWCRRCQLQQGIGHHESLRTGSRQNLAQTASSGYFAVYGRLRSEPLPDKQSTEFRVLMGASFNLENLADVIESELAIIGEAFIEHNITTTKEATAVLLDDLSQTLVLAISNLKLAVRDNDEIAAVNVISVSHDVRRPSDEFLSLQSRRISSEHWADVELVRLEMELLDKLRRI